MLILCTIVVRITAFVGTLYEFSLSTKQGICPKLFNSEDPEADSNHRITKEKKNGVDCIK